MLPDPRDWVFDQVFEMFAAIGEAFADAYKALLLETIKLLIKISLPSQNVIQGEWFSTALGGTFGLASRVMTLIAIIIALWVALTVTRNHGKRLSKLISTMFLLALMVPLFYPVYALLADFSRGLSLGALNLAKGTSDGGTDVAEQLANVALPANPIGMAFVAFVGMVISAIMVVQVFALNIWMLLILLFYPLSIALRPVHKVFNDIFNALNSGILTVLFSVPVMSFCLVFVVIGIEYVPGGNTSTGAVVMTIIGGLAAILTPFVLAVFLYHKSSEIFGATDAAMSGALDINSMPPMTKDDMRDSVDDNHGSALGAFATTVVPGIIGGQILGGDNLMDEVKRYGADAAATAATVAGHPYIAAGVKAAQAYANDRRIQEGDGE